MSDLSAIVSDKVTAARGEGTKIGFSINRVMLAIFYIVFY